MTLHSHRFLKKSLLVVDYRHLKTPVKKNTSDERELREEVNSCLRLTNPVGQLCLPMSQMNLGSYLNRDFKAFGAALANGLSTFLGAPTGKTQQHNYNAIQLICINEPEKL